MPEIKVLCGAHGNEFFGPALDELLAEERLFGVESRIAHPEAVKAGVRYIGSYQLQAHYPGDPAGDAEDVAAYRNMQWLGRNAGSDKTLIYDIHNTITPGNNYAAVGRRALRATLAGAWLLGYKNCCLEPGKFSDSIPNAVLLENSIPAGGDFRKKARQLREGLGKLALCSIEKLEDVYDKKAGPGLRFYSRHEIFSTVDGQLAPYLPDLEAIPARPAFEPLDLSDDLREVLGVDEKCEVVFNSNWGHRNMSPARPDLGVTADGMPRRAYFGAFLLPIDPPIVDGAWLQFDEAPN